MPTLHGQNQVRIRRSDQRITEFPIEEPYFRDAALMPIGEGTGMRGGSVALTDRTVAVRVA